MHHPTIRVSVTVSTSQYGERSAIHVVEERTVPIVELEPLHELTVDQWHVLAHVIEDYAERAIIEAQGQAHELADRAPRETVDEPS